MHVSSLKKLTAALVLAAAYTLAPGANAADLTKVKFVILTQPNIWDAGTFAAIDQGFF